MNLRIIAALALSALCAGCTVTPPESDIVSVSASIYPLAFLAQEVGKGATNVRQITAAGLEPHDFEPTPADIAAIRASKILLFNGSVDAWAEEIAANASEKNILAIRMMDHVPLLHLEEEPQEEEYADHEDHGTVDPHIWLDPVLMQTQTAVIRDAFIQADPSNTQVYTSNAMSLTQKFAALDASFTNGLQSCALKEIVVSHNAFQYLSARYGFKTVAIAGLSPEEEPSAKRLAEIADIVKEKNIQYIFFESLMDPKLSDTIAQETGAQTLVLHPLEGLSSEEVEKGATYFSVMEQNLKNLRTAMQCQ